jgi:uncharacterized membrane protein YhhN
VDLLLPGTVVLLLAAFDWFAVAAGLRRLEYFAKPSTLLSLLLWFLLAGVLSPGGGWPERLVLLGLACSLAGDLFLMLPGDHLMAGLIAFLLAHLAYIPAFLATGVHWGPGALAIALLIAGAAAVILARLREALTRAGRRSLARAVTAYGLVLAVMSWSAMTRLLDPSWPRTSATLLALGGFFFFVSDSVLGWNRFVEPKPPLRVFEMVTYHLAQLGIAVAFLLR